MRKHLLLLLTLVCGVIAISCDDKKEKDDVNNGGNNKVLTPDEQKAFIEEVAIDLSNKIPASDFNDLKVFTNDLIGVFKDYSWTTVKDSINSALNKCFDEEPKKYNTGSKKYSYGTINYGDEMVYYQELLNYYDVTYPVTLLLSNFNGHYRAGDKSWSYEEANDLQFLFQDGEGKDCVLKLSKEGKEVKCKIPSYESGIKSETRYITKGVELDTLNRVIRYYTSHIKFTLSIPEKTTVSLTRDGMKVVTVTYKCNLNNLTADDYFDFGRSNLSQNTLIELSNGYKLESNGVNNGNSKLSLNYVLSNSSGELVSFTVSGDPSGIPSFVVGDNVYDGNIREELIDNKETNVRNMYLNVSLMGKASVTGRVADLRAFLELNDSTTKYDRNEELFKKYLAKANEMLDLGLYYTGSSNKQASMELEAVQYDNYDLRKEWNSRPVLVFSDGVRTSFGDYFNSDDFSKVIEAFKKLAKESEKL